MAGSGSYPFSNQAHHKHPRVRRQVIEFLIHQILSQSLRVGEQLPPTGVLCDTLQVSRTAAREAISVLVAKGIVASKPGEGSTVQPLSQWMLLDPEVLNWLRESDMASSIIEHLLEVRLIIEPEAAALASIRGTMEQFMALQEALARMSAGKTRRTRESVQGDIDFHNRILDISGNIFLARLRDLCMVSVELIIRLTYENVESVHATIENHTMLYEAIKARQPDLARRRAKQVLAKTIVDLQNLNIPFRQDIIQRFGNHVT